MEVIKILMKYSVDMEIEVIELTRGGDQDTHEVQCRHGNRGE